jgi:ABC-2 type transport system permease protein
VWLSVATSRALIVGLLYVFIWEGVVTRLFSGVRYFSIRQYTLGIADSIIDAPRRVYDPKLEPATAAVLAAVVTAVMVVMAIRALRRWEIGEAS